MADIIIRGSSAGIFRNSEFLSDANNACPRKSYLRHLNIQEKPNAFTKIIFGLGFQFERYFADNWKFVGTPQFEVAVHDDNFTGHADVVDDEFVYETKSCSSKNTYAQVYKKGIAKSNHIFQLCHYLIALERTKGRLCYGSYVTKDLDYSKMKQMQHVQIAKLLENAIPEIRVFDVTIEEAGFIHVNGEPYENLHVSEFLNFRTELTSIIEQNELPPRVESLKLSGWTNPCQFCPLATLCETNVTNLEEFVESAAEIFEAVSDSY